MLLFWFTTEFNASAKIGVMSLLVIVLFAAVAALALGMQQLGDV